MAGELSTTRAELRRRVGHLLGDVLELSATANGSTTTLIDTVRLNNSIERPLNRDIVFTSGLNAGTVRRVTAASTDTGTLTFAAIANATAANDTAELYNFRTKGWLVREYDSAINQAIEATYPGYLEMADYDLGAFDVDQGGVLAPAEMTHMATLWYVDDFDRQQEIPNGSSINDLGWYILGSSLLPSTKVISVNGSYYRSILNGRTLYARGYARPTPLSSDTSTTAMRPDYIVNKAASILCLSAIDRDPGNYNRGLLFREDAERNKPFSRKLGGVVALRAT